MTEALDRSTLWLQETFTLDIIVIDVVEAHATVANFLLRYFEHFS